MIPLPPATIVDGFDQGLCIAPCRGAAWAIAQRVDGQVAVAPAPARRGRALLAQAGPKRGASVAKADLVARIAPVAAGGRIRVRFDLRIPAGSPANSIQLLDIECARCGDDGNPGVRLYLRHGRLRVDRSKIGVPHAWTNEAAPQLAAERWHRIDATFGIGDAATGSVTVRLDGRVVLAARGATVDTRLPRLQADRVQIGITANSNPVPARLWIDDVRIDVTR